MKLLSFLGLFTGGLALVTPAFAVWPDVSYNSVTVGDGTTGVGSLNWWSVSGARKTLCLQGYQGGLVLGADYIENSNFSNDGGVYVYGSPVRIGLGGTPDGSNVIYDGVFEIWAGGDMYTGTTASPAFQVNTANDTAGFKGVNVAVAKQGTTGGNLTVEGTLTVAGKQVATVGAGAWSFSSGTAAGSNSFAINGGSTGSSAPNSFAGGSGATASASGSFAFGGPSTIASGLNSFAFGGSAVAGGSASLAFGTTATVASGATGAIALGSGSQAENNGGVAIGGGHSYDNSAALLTAIVYGNRSIGSGNGINICSQSSAGFGTYNVLQTGNRTTWVNVDPLFTVGNGTGETDRSNAILTSKNGQTSLTNKYWVDGTHALDTITTTGAAAGEALVVNGNTRLRGKVVLEQAQGDISMGAYGTP